MLISDKRLFRCGSAEHLICNGFVIVNFGGVFLNFRGDEPEIILYTQYHKQLSEIVCKESKQNNYAVVVYVKGVHIADAEERNDSLYNCRHSSYGNSGVGISLEFNKRSKSAEHCNTVDKE